MSVEEKIRRFFPDPTPTDTIYEYFVTNMVQFVVIKLVIPCCAQIYNCFEIDILDTDLPHHFSGTADR